MLTIDPVDLAAKLISTPSVTPASGAVFDVLGGALEALGFTVHRFTLGEAPDGPTENMVAIRSAGPGPHFGFAGHLDVVPPGEGWSGDRDRVFRSRRRFRRAAAGHPLLSHHRR
jgi:succinyl-diaminopimelate desuccinylase